MGIKAAKVIKAKCAVVVLRRLPACIYTEKLLRRGAKGKPAAWQMVDGPLASASF